MTDPFLMIRHGLIDHKHQKRMGNSLWLYLWLMVRVDWSTGRVRWNMGEASEYYDVAYATIRKWRRLLENGRYIKTDVTRGATGYLESIIQKWIDPRTRLKMGVQSVTDTVTHTVTDTVTPIHVLPTDSDIPDESDLPVVPATTAESATEVTQYQNPDFGRLAQFWEQNFGALTPHNAELLRDGLETYGAEIVLYALKEAIGANVRRWNYAQTIMERVKVEGYSSKPNGKAHKSANGNGKVARTAAEAKPAPDVQALRAKIRAAKEGQQ